MKKILKDRYFIVSALFVLFGAVIISQLVDLQIVRGKEFNSSSRYVAMKDRPVPAARGRIFDRNGVPIAVNRESYTVYIANAELNDVQLNDMLFRLSNIFVKNGDPYNQSIGDYLLFSPLAFNSKKTEKQIIAWQKDKELFAMKDSEVKNTPEGLFQYLRDQVFKIDKKYTDEEAYRIMALRYEIKKSQWNFNTGKAICLAKGVDEKTVAEIEEQHHHFPGLITDVEPVREYIDAMWIAHVLGYTGPINEEQYANMKDQGYTRNDWIGQNGIEAAAERYLRGTNGTKKVEPFSTSVFDSMYTNEAIPGNDIILTIDMKLQKAAAESLERTINEIKHKGGNKNFGDANAGAAVAIDVRTGDILAMASYPTFDPLDFLHRDQPESAKRINQLWEEGQASPTLNRAISGLYAPGSTFKPLTAIAALEEGVITPEWKYLDRGYFDFSSNVRKFCLERPRSGHGYIDLQNALATSCNIYFYDIGVRASIEKIDKWAELFGLGEYTGVDLFNEYKGTRGNPQYKKDKFNDKWWPIADTAQTSIGQLYNRFTPLQIANYISTLANGGKKYKPHVIQRVVKYDGSIVNDRTPEYEQVPVKPENIEAIKQGMIAVNNSEDGTANAVFKNFPIMVAGKTGTPETGREKLGESSHGLYVCYAPADDPQIAVAVVIEHGVWGANAAPVAKDILTEYFGLNGNTVRETILPDEPVLAR